MFFKTYQTPITSDEGQKLIRISPIIHSNAFLSLKAVDENDRCVLGVWATPNPLQSLCTRAIAVPRVRMLGVFAKFILMSV